MSNGKNAKDKDKVGIIMIFFFFGMWNEAWFLM